MTNTTTAGVDRRRRARILGLPVGTFVMSVSVIVHVAFLGAAWHFDLFGTTLMFDRAEEERRTAEVELREAQRKAQEEAERAKRVMSEEHREKLRREADEKARREMAQKVQEIRRNRDQLRELREQRLAEIEHRPQELARLAKLEEVRRETVVFSREAQRQSEAAPEAEAPREVLAEARLLQEQLDAYEQALRADLNRPVSRLDDEPMPRQAEQAGQALMEAAEQATQAAQANAAEEHPDVPQRGAVNLHRRAQRLTERLENLVGHADVEAFNDTTAARHPPSVDTADADRMHEMVPGELYDLAQRLEQDAYETFAQVRAAELAMRQNTSFNEAAEKLSTNAPSRPDLSAALRGDEMQTVGELGQYRESLGQAVAETENMRLATSNQLSQAGAMGSTAQASAAGQDGGDSRYAQMFALGQATHQGRQADISALMRAAMLGSLGDGGSSDSVLYSDSNLAGGGEHFTSAGVDELPRIQISQQQVAAQALPGRRFSRDTDRKGWLYIDTWYIIGPWENGGRIDYSNTHPPEWEIDFDAVYDGKLDGDSPRQLRWRFTQSDMIRVTPPDEVSNATYYAYTELYFEEDAEMLLAIASDDAAKVWINDLLVWQDSGLSAWKIGEGFRKVFFQRGYNRILVRIENGPVVCQFSVLICPPEIAAGR